MRAASYAVVVVLALVGVQGVARGDPLDLYQWSSADGGNDHFYALTTQAREWDAAQAEAQSYGGNLVTIGSAAENAFLVSAFLSGSDIGNTYWIGLTDEDTEGVFVWVTGEPLSYTNWNDGEPNDFAHGVLGIDSPGEDHVAINWHYAHGHADGVVGDWNDLPIEGYQAGGVEPYFGIIEFAPPAVPEPTSLALFGLGAGALALRRRKRKLT